MGERVWGNVQITECSLVTMGGMLYVLYIWGRLLIISFGVMHPLGVLFDISVIKEH